MIRRSEAITIRDVARHAGVSPATVSRYLTRSAPLALETACRVKQAMDDLGYVPRLAARSLATHKTYHVGLVSNAINYAFFGPLLQGIEEVLLEHGYHLLMATYRDGSPETRPVLGPHNTDGVIVFSHTLMDEQLQAWYETNFPCVLIYRTAPAGLSIPCVNVENRQVSRQLVEHLIEAHGKRRIVFIRAPDYQEDVLEREQGYREALAAHALEYDERFIVGGGYSRQDAPQMMEQFFCENPPACDAVFACDDDLALSVIGALSKAGVSIPDEMAVVGFDDQRFASLIVPPLTTVRSPTEEVGRTAAHQILRLIQGQVVEEHILLPTEVVIRRSCGCSVR